MRADWDDAPKRTRSKNEYPSVVTILAIAAIGAAGAYWARQPATPPNEIVEPQAAQPAPPTLTTEKNYEQDQPDLAPLPPPGRQTVFNDDNYAPRQPVNIMESVHARRAAEQQAARPRPATRPSNGLNGTQHTRFRWRDARGDQTWWSSNFTYRNSIIDNASFCKSYRWGSIEYRTCRKAARDWLKDMCRAPGPNVTEAWRSMYCTAASSYRP